MSMTDPIIGFHYTSPNVVNLFAGQQFGLNANIYIWDQSGNFVLTAGMVTAAGTYNIFRMRGGDSTLIDTGTPTAEVFSGSLRVKFPLDFASNVFLPGDVILTVVAGIQLTVGGKTFRLPVMEGFVTITGENVAAQGLIQAGSTTTAIITDIDADDGLFDGMQVSIEQDNSGLPDYFVTRNIKHYDNATKTFTLDEAIPFTPVAGNIVLVLNKKSSAGNVEDLARLLGLMQENIWIINTFDGTNHTGSVIELYDSPANATAHDGSTGLVAKYTFTATVDNDKPINTLMVKD
jgi:hypothetical protein